MCRAGTWLVWVCSKTVIVFMLFAKELTVPDQASAVQLGMWVKGKVPTPFNAAVLRSKAAKENQWSSSPNRWNPQIQVRTWKRIPPTEAAPSISTRSRQSSSQAAKPAKSARKVWSKLQAESEYVIFWIGARIFWNPVRKGSKYWNRLRKLERVPNFDLVVSGSDPSRFTVMHLWNVRRCV